MRCRGLIKHYDAGKVVAVDGLDLDVAVGECFGLLGPNGAGKTTTVEILEGLLDSDGRRRRGAGHALRQRRAGVAREARRLAPADPLARQALGPGGRASVPLVLRERPFAGRRAAHRVARREAGAWVEKLSGGQKQRLAVACALVGDPELLFLDEPTTGLDPQSRLQLWDVVLGFKKRGRTVLLTTHYMDEAERLCDRVGIVDHGKTIALGTPRELISSLGGQEVIELAVTGGELDEVVVGKLSGVHGVRHVADGFALAAEPLHVALPAVLDHVRAGRVDARTTVDAPRDPRGRFRREDREGAS